MSFAVITPSVTLMSKHPTSIPSKDVPEIIPITIIYLTSWQAIRWLLSISRKCCELTEHDGVAIGHRK